MIHFRREFCAIASYLKRFVQFFPGMPDQSQLLQFTMAPKMPKFLSEPTDLFQQKAVSLFNIFPSMNEIIFEQSNQTKSSRKMKGFSSSQSTKICGSWFEIIVSAEPKILSFSYLLYTLHRKKDFCVESFRNFSMLLWSENCRVCLIKF